jgi:signal transduction histidine kinase
MHIPPARGRLPHKGNIDAAARAIDRGQPVGLRVGGTVSLVSHDLRSPLQALLGSAELLVEALQGIDIPRVNARAETILRVTKRMAGMIDDLYRTTELEEANVTLSFAPVDVSTLADTIYESIADAHSRGRIRFELQPDLPAVEIDEPKMERALMNLVTNALKYSDEDVTVRARRER